VNSLKRCPRPPRSRCPGPSPGCASRPPLASAQRGNFGGAVDHHHLRHLVNVLPLASARRGHLFASWPRRSRFRPSGLAKIFCDNTGVLSRHWLASRHRFYQRAIRSEEFVPIGAVGVAATPVPRGLRFVHARNYFGTVDEWLTAGSSALSRPRCAEQWGRICHDTVNRRLTVRDTGFQRLDQHSQYLVHIKRSFLIPVCMWCGSSAPPAQASPQRWVQEAPTRKINPRRCTAIGPIPIAADATLIIMVARAP
jgi:hypothetical protein